jgi:hypothetical protein
MKLAQALKHKNRLIKKINNVKSNISEYNSNVKGATKEVDVAIAMKEYDQLIKDLIELKIKMFEASRSIREHIFKLSELKAEISWLRGISTRRGEVRRQNYMGNDGESIEYEVVFSRQEIETRVENNEAEIDKLQEEIDTFNYTTEID